MKLKNTILLTVRLHCCLHESASLLAISSDSVKRQHLINSSVRPQWHCFFKNCWHLSQGGGWHGFVQGCLHPSGLGNPHKSEQFSQSVNTYINRYVFIHHSISTTAISWWNFNLVVGWWLNGMAISATGMIHTFQWTTALSSARSYTSFATWKFTCFMVAQTWFSNWNFARQTW